MTPKEPSNAVQHGPQASRTSRTCAINVGGIRRYQWFFWRGARVPYLLIMLIVSLIFEGDTFVGIIFAVEGT